jgi:hypothetical protein
VTERGVVGTEKDKQSFVHLESFGEVIQGSNEWPCSEHFPPTLFIDKH